MPENRRRNPVAHASIMRKGGVHQPSRSAERQKEKRKLEKAVAEYTATKSGRFSLWFRERYSSLISNSAFKASITNSQVFQTCRTNHWQLRGA